MLNKVSFFPWINKCFADNKHFMPMDLFKPYADLQAKSPHKVKVKKIKKMFSSYKL